MEMTSSLSVLPEADSHKKVDEDDRPDSYSNVCSSQMRCICTDSVEKVQHDSSHEDSRCPLWSQFFRDISSCSGMLS